MNRNQRRGFTLIELLVVIAIIAILAAILFPVFAQAREKARQTTCISNEKQIGLGVMQYVQDYDESFPFNDYIINGGPEVPWYQAIGPYVKNGQVYSDGNYNGLGGVWSCPDEPVDQPAVYGANDELMPDGLNVGNGSTVSIATIQSPSNIVMVAEKGMNDGNASWEKFNPYQAMWTNNGSSPNYPAFCTTASAANNYTYPANQHSDVSGNGTGIGGDCDSPTAQGVEGTTVPNWGTDYHGCGVMPRYRHAGNSVSDFLFCDGHAKAVPKGRLNWYTNVYVQGPYEKNINNGYPPC